MTRLEAEIRSIIVAEGPIPVARYMELCLTHPRYGYYVTRDPFGVGGDFTTAPEISQMFGELIGAWCATVWRQMGAPRDVSLMELGPGRGTLMADALRAAKGDPEFLGSISIHLLETSPVLRRRQQALLQPTGASIVWHERIEDVPGGPTIAIANEFVDALPIHQFVKDVDGWHLRMVGVVDDRLTFVVMPDAMADFVEEAFQAPVGAILERRYDRPIALLAGRIALQGGAALIVDYGHAATSFGDTMQAVRGHKFVDPLADPGEADLTAQVDFADVARWAQRQGAQTQGPVTQGDFLRRLGIEGRAARLKAGAAGKQAADIDATLARLIAPDQMGELFKVMAFAAPGVPRLPGFDT
jgi:SAM-dependent MidA family methyltransferase